MPTRTTSRDAERLLPLVVGAVGVVFGDIGTSPLDAFSSDFLRIPPNRIVEPGGQVEI